MLAELPFLLNEPIDALRRDQPGVPLIWISGVASPGKSRLLKALHDRLAPAGVQVHGSDGPPSQSRATRSAALLHVHAETDLEALLEPQLLSASRAAARVAELTVPVDWEAADRSVARVCQLLTTRGIGTVSVRGV